MKIESTYIPCSNISKLSTHLESSQGQSPLARLKLFGKKLKERNTSTSEVQQDTLGNQKNRSSILKLLIVLLTLFMHITIIPTRQKIHLIWTEYYSEHNVYVCRRNERDFISKKIRFYKAVQNFLKKISL